MKGQLRKAAAIEMESRGGSKGKALLLNTAGLSGEADAASNPALYAEEFWCCRLQSFPSMSDGGCSVLLHTSRVVAIGY
jgi:hypothetical protein